MSDPVLHVLAGPNGAGKTTLYERVIGPVTSLPFVNADRIAAARWPGNELAHGHEAAAAAAAERARLIGLGESFVAETVFSHPSKVDLLAAARSAGYLVTLHVVMVPLDLAVLRVGDRVGKGGHDVPEVKIEQRWHRLWGHVVAALPEADEAVVYDNSRAADPYRRVAVFRHGRPVGPPDWPDWTPSELRAAAA